MRYELENGYISKVFFGCSSGKCTLYKGDIPSGYDSLEKWADNANIRAYKISNGNLVYDANRDATLKSEWANMNRYRTALGKVGKNVFNGKTEAGGYNTTTGAKDTNTSLVRNKKPIKVDGGKSYIISNNGAGVGMHVLEYGKSGNFIKYLGTISAGQSFTTSSATSYINIYRSNSNVDRIQVESGTTITSYEAYVEKKIYTINDNNGYDELLNVDNANNQQNYTKFEQVIGTFLGKPLYRTVVDLGSGDISRSIIQTGISNMEILKSLDCCVKNTSDSGWRTIPFIYTKGDKVSIGNGEWAGGVWLSGDGVLLTFEMGSSLGSITKGYATIEYTKTTD